MNNTPRPTLRSDSDPGSRPHARRKVLAASQTACVCAAVEAAVFVPLGVFTDSYLGAAGVSLLTLGPLSLWMAPLLYRRLLNKEG